MISSGQLVNLHQKSLLAKSCLKYSTDLLERHLMLYEREREAVLDKIEWVHPEFELKFPNIDNFAKISDNDGIEVMFPTLANVHEPCNKACSETLKILANRSPEEEKRGFLSARELLTISSIKKCGPTKERRAPVKKSTKEKDFQQNMNACTSQMGNDFNFSATKKSLGGIGRIGNLSMKRFVSPVPNKCTKTKDAKSDADVEQLLLHPNLKNIDPKMVEMISNEIISKFKAVDWSEIAGLSYAKSIIKEAVVYPLIRPDIFTGLRRPPRGILLFGPPGTGKTLIGKCIASQSSATFFSISAASLTSKWLGEGEKMVRTLFAVANARQPSVIFIDEVDSLLSQRSDNENEGTRRLKTEFLVRLDGADTTDDDRVLIVGATNRPQELDDAVRRRFVKRLYVPLPELNARIEILGNLLNTVDNHLDANDIIEIAQIADGYSGADMDSLCREASMEPLRCLPAGSIMTLNKDMLRPVVKADFLKAVKKIRASVSQKDLDQYVQWNNTYGSTS